MTSRQPELNCSLRPIDLKKSFRLSLTSLSWRAAELRQCTAENAMSNQVKRSAGRHFVQGSRVGETRDPAQLFCASNTRTFFSAANAFCATSIGKSGAGNIGPFSVQTGQAKAPC